MQFYLHYLWYGTIIEKTVCRQNTNMYMRASLETFLHFHIQKLLLLSVFCWYFRNFVVTNYILVGLTMYRQISKCTDKTPKKALLGGGGGGRLLPPPPPPTLWLR